jgi:hypothetical protein
MNSSAIQLIDIGYRRHPLLPGSDNTLALQLPVLSWNVQATEVFNFHFE